MDVRQIDPNDSDQTTLKHTAKLIEAGAVVIFPTDTSYGMATNPLNPEAVNRLYKIKQRDENEPIACVFRDIDQVEQFGRVNARQLKILKRNLPGPFTFILEPKNNVLPWPTLGVRIPDYLFTKALSHETTVPFTATSANIHGQPATYSLQEILAQFEGKIYQPDLILNAGVLRRYPPSTVVDIRSDKPIILREGIARPKF